MIELLSEEMGRRWGSSMGALPSSPIVALDAESIAAHRRLQSTGLHRSWFERGELAQAQRDDRWLEVLLPEAHPTADGLGRWGSHLRRHLLRDVPAPVSAPEGSILNEVLHLPRPILMRLIRMLGIADLERVTGGGEEDWGNGGELNRAQRNRLRRTLANAEASRDGDEMVVAVSLDEWLGASPTWPMVVAAIGINVLALGFVPLPAAPARCLALRMDADDGTLFLDSILAWRLREMAPIDSGRHWIREALEELQSATDEAMLGGNGAEERDT